MAGIALRNRCSAYLLSIMRIVFAFLFMQHGGQKLFDFPVAKGGAEIQFFSTMGAAGALELFGGMLLLVGLLTRPVAFILAGEMAVAYFIAHLPRGVWPIANKGELAMMFCFAFLYLSMTGGGPLSLDRLLQRK